MIPELGQFALMLALAMALVQAVFPLYGALAHVPAWTALAKPAARGQLALVAVAFACLTYAFVVDDFSVAYVAQHSNSHLPLVYRVAGVWGGHEGSLLLWSLILALWGGALALFSRRIPTRFVALALAVLALLSLGFLLFMVLTSNPFARLAPAPLDGRDLNPLLQDIGLVVHPPMLYIGYVGFAVVFAFAIAALLSGRLDSAWARWARPWTNLAWVFLTIGIALGSWWAYYELGWGGWWFWDPVENASFMPWLAGTALIHSLAATEKRGAFKAWTILLAVATFSLSLLGAFLVRSGVLTSVHAFATDPQRGLFVLVFLGVVSGGALALYAWRAPRLISRVSFTFISREMGILVNNVFLGALCVAVLLGTLYPLILDTVSGAKISVGAPYFDFLFAVLGAPLMLCMGFAAWLRWRRDRLARLGRKLRAPALLSLAIGAALPLGMAHYSLAAAFGLALGCWVIISTAAALWARLGSAWLRDARRLSRAVYGMSLAHIGVGVFIIGVVFTHAYSIEKDVRMAAGDTIEVAGYRFRFTGVSAHRGANYQAARGEFVVTAGRPQSPIATLYPEKRTYLVQQSPMTEAAIDAGITRDLYVALGEPLGASVGESAGESSSESTSDDSQKNQTEQTAEQTAWAVRIYYKPFIRWIWGGALLMALGGLWAATGRRRPPPTAAESANRIMNRA